MAPKAKTMPVAPEKQADPDEISPERAKGLTPKELAEAKEVARLCRLARERNPEAAAFLDQVIMEECERGTMWPRD